MAKEIESFRYALELIFDKVRTVKSPTISHRINNIYCLFIGALLGSLRLIGRMCDLRFSVLFLVLILTSCASTPTYDSVSGKLLPSGGRNYLPVNHRAQEKLLRVLAAVSIGLEFFGRSVGPVELKRLSMQHGFGSRLNDNIHSKSLFIDRIAGLRSVGSLWREETFPLRSPGFNRGKSRVIRLLRSDCLDSRIKCNMIEVIRRCLVEKLLRGLKVKTFSWPGIQQPRDVVQADLAHA